MVDGAQLVTLVVKRASERWRTDHFVPGWSLSVESQLGMSLRMNQAGFLEHIDQLPPDVREHLDALRRLRGEPVELSEATVSRLADGYVQPRTGLWKSELEAWRLTPDTRLPAKALRSAIVDRLHALAGPTDVPWTTIEFALPALPSDEDRASLLLRVAPWKFQSRAAIWQRLRPLPGLRAILERALEGAHASSAAYFLAQLQLDESGSVPEAFWAHLDGFAAHGHLHDAPLDQRLFGALPRNIARRALEHAGEVNRSLRDALEVDARPAIPVAEQPEAFMHPELGEMRWDESREAYVCEVLLSLGGAPESIPVCLRDATSEHAALATRIVRGGAASRWPTVIEQAVASGDVADRWELESRRMHTTVFIYDGSRWSIELFLEPEDGGAVDTFDELPLVFDFLDDE